MTAEEREYILHMQVYLANYMKAYEEIGMPVQVEILGGFLGYFVTEFGVQNQLTHLWGYEELEDRRRRRAKLAQNPQWQHCLSIFRPMIMTMQDKIMYPTSFSPIRTLASRGASGRNSQGSRSRPRLVPEQTFGFPCW